VQLSAPMNIPDLKIVWLVEPGARAKAGDVVIRFDSSGAKRQLDEQSAALRQAKASLDQALAQARTTAEQDKLDLATARYDVERAKLEASKQAIVSVLQGETSKIDLATAQAKLRVQEAAVEMHRKSDEAKIASVKRQCDKAQADVNLTTARIEQTNLKAPIEGLVSFATNYSQGWMNAQPFKVGDQVWPGAVVGEIPDTATLQMEAKIEEVDRGRITVGNEVRIHIDSLPEHVFAGKVGSISQLTRMTWDWPPSRIFVGYAPIESPDARLRPGMNGSTDVVVRHIPNAISVPAKAVFTRDGKPIVYIAEAKGFRTVYVEVLARNPDEVAVRGPGIGASSKVALAEPEQERP
jgi:multidrug efflux pump subunit AcrA (membrane-fusion protein)